MASQSKQSGGCLTALLGIFGLGQGGQETAYARRVESSTESSEEAEVREIKTYPYRVRDSFLIDSERSFYHVLRQVVGERADICIKVRLWDIFYVAQPHKHPGARPHIDRKHVDFLLCHPNTIQPLVGIELDGSSHEAEDRKQRDAEVDAVFETAQLPLLHIPVKPGYNTQELATLLSPYIGQSSQPPASAKPEKQPLPASIQVNADGQPLCPKCGAPMVVRVAERGQYKGKRFYACSNYPNCKNIIPMSSNG